MLILTNHGVIIREAAKKVLFLVDSPQRGVEGVRGCPLRKKKKFMFFFYFVAVLLTTKPRRGWGQKALVDCPLKKIFFCGFPYKI